MGIIKIIFIVLVFAFIAIGSYAIRKMRDKRAKKASQEKDDAK